MYSSGHQSQSELWIQKSSEYGQQLKPQEWTRTFTPWSRCCVCQDPGSSSVSGVMWGSWEVLDKWYIRLPTENIKSARIRELRQNSEGPKLKSESIKRTPEGRKEEGTVEKEDREPHSHRNKMSICWAKSRYLRISASWISEANDLLFSS